MAVGGDQNSATNYTLGIERKKGESLEWVSDPGLARVCGEGTIL